MDRRTFVTGGVVAAATLAVAPSVIGLKTPEAEMLPLEETAFGIGDGALSPVFSKFTDRIMSVVFNQPQEIGNLASRLTITNTITNTTDFTEVASVAEAEDRYFESLRTVMTISRNKKTSDDDFHRDLQIAICRASNRIATLTYRACGNRVFGNPAIISLFGTSTGKTNGRWTIYDGHENRFVPELFASEELPKDRLYVVYNGQTDVGCDGPGGIVQKDDVIMFLSRKSVSEGAVKPEDYGQVIQICLEEPASI